MEIVFGLVALTIGLVVLASLIGFVIWVYRRFVPVNTSLTDLKNAPLSSIFSKPVTYPKNFGIAVTLVLLGFNLGLYHFFGLLFDSNVRVPAAGWLVWSIGVTAAWVVLLWGSRSKFIWSTLAVSMLSSLFLYLHANGFVQTWNIIFFLFSQVLLFVSIIKSRLPLSVGGWLGAVVSTLPVSLIQALAVCRSLFVRDPATTTGKSSGSFISWIKTIVLAFIVLAIFMGLLSQADPVFAEVVREFRAQLLGRTLWSLFFVFLVAGWWTAPRTEQTDVETQANWLSYRDVVAVLLGVLVVIGIFLSVQFQYLFGASRELLVSLDLTFSEYVRKGFSELLLAVFIGGIISYLAAARSHFWSGAEQKLTRIATTILISELGLLLLSAWKRDILYLDTYGMTRVRVIGEIFLAWLAFFLVVLLVYSWRKLSERLAVTMLWVGALVVLVTINVLNIDRMVVSGAPGHHEYTDYFYLFQLSEDAAPAWPELLDEVVADTQPLLAKESLTPEEKAQLAGLKLSLVSFIETRDELYLQYAPTNWLLENGQKIGMDFSSDQTQMYPYFWQNKQGVIEVITGANTSSEALSSTQNTATELPENLEKYRSWQFSNRAERTAYELLSAQEERIFELPATTLKEILRYQLRTQTNLETEENRLRYELMYQFITVRLDRYYQGSMYPADITVRTSLSPLARDVWTELEATAPVSLETAAALTCSSAETVAGTPLEVVAVSRRSTSGMVVDTRSLLEQYPFMRGAEQLTLTRFAEPTQPLSIQVFMPLKMQYLQTVPTDTVSNDRNLAVMEKPLSMGDTDYLLSQDIFVRALVRPQAVTTGDSCRVVFVADKIQAFSSI